MPKQIIIAEQHQIAAVFSEDQIQELVVATGHHQIGDVYLGVVENVLPGIDAAFVNIGDPERNGFIHVTDLGPLKLKRTAAAITELLAPQQKVLVQVMKEPTGTKGPRLTGNITFPGRYVVLMPYGRGVNLSRRIKSESERNRLRALAILIKPAGMGLLVRTEAEGKPEEAIIEDLELLQKQWEAIQQEANSTRAPALLNRDDDFIQRVLRDMYGADVNRIVVDSSSGLKRVKQYLQNWSGGQTPQGVLFDHHRDRSPILEYFRISAAIKEALKPRVDLPSGGYIIIEPTEALTVVDVNSGSFTRSATARETVLWTNCEAATEIARQLRLRNIAGVIVVDFIDMESRRDQLQVLEHFNKALKADKARPQIAQLTELGLVELTRKRQGQNIYELFGDTCPTCGGLGHIMHLPGETEGRSTPRNDASPTSPGILPKAGELSDRFDIGYPPSKVSLPQKEPRLPIARINDPQENYDAFGEVFDGDSDLGSFDSINHPSYQEARDSKRRVRKSSHNRVGINGVNRKDENPITPLPLGFDNESDLEADISELRPFDKLRASPSSGSTDLERSTRDIVSSGLGKSGWQERTDRDSSFGSEQSSSMLPRTTKVTKVEPIKPIVEPPEIKTVEMTLEEQDVFALMGVSPLVKLEQEAKSSKSVIINIVSPGHLATKLPDSIADTSESEIEELTQEPVSETISSEPADLDNHVSTENTSQVESDEKPVLKNATEPSSSEVKTDMSNRRRRRRSSAVESDSSVDEDT
ncbi:Rne/Rng family ribonuclease [Nodularia harveyana UHCC-0300]|uniref:Rne/Rng family ribonuclease n=1 Tax=Nodularia harveyana UHCC-0300 TaxID=2974287 RepID=A0ABU5UFL0_9CYAN|nr:Rne/Rng family ribonuclease [Nodularia harveyana]MEA5582289.1 Rne/Rng family ribonuclease [Nodularia harveyana UHCC-0300]